MRGFTLVCSIIVACAQAAWAGEWTLVKQGGRDHVTMQNVAEFYGLGQFARVSNKGFRLGNSRRILRGAIGSNELYINNLKFILSYPITEHNGEAIVSRMDLTKVIEPVLRPSHIKDADRVKTIVLDAGHGGHDKGATSIWGMEKNFSLDVARRAKLLLEEAGLQVVLTRDSDEFIPLGERVRIANQHKNALFVSIHFNSGSRAATGLETYTLAPRGVPSMAADGPRLTDLQLCAGHACDAENMALATATHAALVSRSRLYDRGIKRARFVVIRDIQIPGVLIEGGFLSNPIDSRLVATAQYRQEMAASITAAVMQYRKAVGLQSEPNLMVKSMADGSSGPVVSTSAPDRPIEFRRGQPTVITPTAE